MAGLLYWFGGLNRTYVLIYGVWATASNGGWRGDLTPDLSQAERGIGRRQPPTREEKWPWYMRGPNLLGTCFRGTTVVGSVGCWLGMAVVVVTAPVPWVPAVAGTTVVGRVGVDWGWRLGGSRARPLGTGSGSGMTKGGWPSDRLFSYQCTGGRNGATCTDRPHPRPRS